MPLRLKKQPLDINNFNSEAFNALITNIQYSSLRKSIKSIVVTSSNSREGKSTVACNLASAFSQTKKKVLLLDCDFRNPSVHKCFNLMNSNGLSDILLGKYKVDDCLQSCDVNNLYIITCGNIPQNPAQLLSDNLMAQLIAELKENFDLIILDTPPILYFADTQILSAINDGTIIVSRYGKTDKESLIKCRDIVDKIGGKIIGSIINYVPKKASSIYYKKYNILKTI